MIYLWLLPTFICIYIFFKQRFLLSPTALYAMYFAAVLPGPYLISYALDIPSFFYVSPRSIDRGSVQIAFIQVMLSLLAFVAGRFLLPPIRLRWPLMHLLPGRFPLLLGSSLLLALVGAAVVLHVIGGAAALVENNGELRSGGLRGLGAAVYSVTFVLPTVAQFALMYALERRSRYLKWIFALCLISSLLAGVFGFRAGIFVLFIEIGCIVYLITGKPYRKQTLLAIPVLALLISVLGFLRVLTTDAEVTSAAASAGASTLVPLLADTALTRTRGVEMVVIMDDYMSHSRYHYFADNMLETLHAFIPTFVLPKDISLSEKIATQVYSGYLVSSGIEHDIYGGVSYTLIAESTWNLGLLGVVLTGTALGYLFNIVESGSVQTPPSYVHIIAYKSVVAMVIPVLESPQLAINSLILALLLNFGILTFLSVVVRVTPVARQQLPA